MSESEEIDDLGLHDNDNVQAENEIIDNRP
jgi:hypothetical protein